jgi:hypothetical protein
VRRLLPALFVAWALLPVAAPPRAAYDATGAAMACCVASGEACECRIVTGITRCPSTLLATPPLRTPCVPVATSWSVDAPAPGSPVEEETARLVSFAADPPVPPPRA